MAGKIIGSPWYKIHGLNKYDAPDTTFTIGIDTDESLEKTREVMDSYNILKVKVGGPDDKRMIRQLGLLQISR